MPYFRFSYRSKMWELPQMLSFVQYCPSYIGFSKRLLKTWFTILNWRKDNTVKPRNSGQLEQLDFFRYCGVFRYFEGSDALNRTFWGQNLSSIAGFSAILCPLLRGFTVFGSLIWFRINFICLIYHLLRFP